VLHDVNGVPPVREVSVLPPWGGTRPSIDVLPSDEYLLSVGDQQAAVGGIRVVVTEVSMVVYIVVDRRLSERYRRKLVILPAVSVESGVWVGDV